MKQDILNKVETLQGEMISSIQGAIKIPSVISDKEGNYPFGENIDKALRYMLNLCESLGFKTVYKDGYYGYAEIGEGEEIIGILGHVDVVSEGSHKSWKFPPFEGVIDDGKIYGRGTQDDKGPTISAIYAAKSLVDLGVKLNKRIRFIFGTDEENLWRCINKYKENNEEMPTYGFTPDAKFPIINAEKGLLQVNLSCKSNNDIDLSVGESLNAVPGKAIYIGKHINILKKELDRLKYEYIVDGNKISINGKSVHSAVSETGINALTRLCIALNNIGVKSNTVKFLAEVIGEDANGQNIVKNCEDEISGKLTVNAGKLLIKDEEEIAGLDIRVPVTYKVEEVVSNLKKLAEKYQLEYEEYDFLDSIYIPKDSLLVETLRKVYEEETGLDGSPVSSGGATYARALDNCVAFGSIFPGSPETEHQANEFAIISDIVKATKIYALAIYELLKI
ncbi:M20 family metallopeptidase [Metaclostridioides mangenotii]|uniref:M20 family metallopeptidase n=1 Tax=Metaclostridioides mangenotii TaxID=1540 RepID=UPI00048A25FD|nr:M20 family metallopeptidase [Clostridioides mangenotii]